jgi:hypothetical protein
VGRDSKPGRISIPELQFPHGQGPFGCLTRGAWIGGIARQSPGDDHGWTLSVYDVDSQVLSKDLLRLVEQMSAKGLLRIEA